jgi:phospholipase C
LIKRGPLSRKWLRPLAAATPLAAMTWVGAVSIAPPTKAGVPCSGNAGRPVTNGAPQPPGPGNFNKIKHVIVIMQENRSFDHYFGTYPGADGIPSRNGVPVVCVRDPKTGQRVRPFHHRADLNKGGPHAHADFGADVNHGRMNGFIARQEAGLQGCDPLNPVCSPQGTPDVMSYHDAREIPNYWNYAANYVLQDHLFEPTTSWSLPAHLFAVSGWSARCASQTDPTTCHNAHEKPHNFAWTDLTYLLHAHNVSWGYYLAAGNQPDCADGGMACAPTPQSSKVPGIWNPLRKFATVLQDNQLTNIQPVQNFYAQAQAGTLPAVSWVIPNESNSEHPPFLVSAGQAYVTGLVNAVMSGPDWSSTAIFVTWDDWGGFFDHVIPPVVDKNGYGIRVPGLLISPYAKKGFIDHQILSFDAYLKFIEDRFLGGQRLNPATDGRFDPRTTVRESVPILGDMRADFDFTQTPRAPALLPTNPPPGPASR